MKSLLILCLCASSVAASQSTPVTDSVAARRLIDSARAAGLPSDPLVGLMQEGAQRHASTASVLSALRDYVSLLDRAKRALGPRSTDAEIDAGAAVLHLGARESTIAALRAAKPNRDVTMALVVLADLVVRGVAIARAEDALVTLTRVGAPDAALQEFRIGVQRDLDAGQGAESSLLKRTRETVSRFRPGGPPKPPGVQLDDATISSMARGMPPQTVSRALASDMSDGAGAIAEARATATPFALLPGLQLRTTIDGAIDRSSGVGRVGGEGLATFGTSNARRGVALGVGASAVSGGMQRAPIAYGAAWLTLFGIESRIEARSARLSTSSGTRFTDDNSLTQTFLQAARVSALATGDTGVTNSPPPTSPGPVTPDSGNAGPTTTSPSAISDFRLELSRRVGRVNLEGATGVRVLDHKPLDSWAALNVATWILPSVAIVSGWSTRRTIARADVPGSMNAILGLRWHPADAAPKPAKDPANVGRAEGVLRTVGSVTEFVLIAGAAHRVEVSGDFTQWAPVDMVRADGSHWRIALPRDRTMIRLHVRLDGGAWMVPAGIPRTRDVFGEELGALVLDTGAPR